jgi:hypothetical protein
MDPLNGAARSVVTNGAVTGGTANRSRAVTVMRAKALAWRADMQKNYPESLPEGGWAR